MKPILLHKDMKLEEVEETQGEITLWVQQRHSENEWQSQRTTAKVARKSMQFQQFLLTFVTANWWPPEWEHRCISTRKETNTKNIWRAQGPGDGSVDNVLSIKHEDLSSDLKLSSGRCTVHLTSTSGLHMQVSTQEHTRVTKESET